MRRAKGLAIFTVVKAGFVWSARVGSGIVVARLPDGSWSAPSTIGTGGVGFGLQAGADLSEFVMVLNSDEAVKAFSKSVRSKLRLLNHANAAYRAEEATLLLEATFQHLQVRSVLEEQLTLP